MLKKILIGLVVVVVGFLGFASTRPDSCHVERRVLMDAPASVVFAQLDDLKAWAAWSPWEKMDPNMAKTFDGSPRGVGASYAWQGNDKVGKGKMTIIDSQPPGKIAYRLEFIEPFTAVATNAFSLAPGGGKATAVTWSMDTTNGLIGKIFGLFMDMDASVGADFEKGLADLKIVAEASAKKQAEDAAAAKANADVEAAAQKAAVEKAAAEAAAAEAASKTKGKKKR